MGQYKNVGSIIALMVYINIVICVLYFLTRWGSELVKSATEERNRAKSLLGEIEKTMEAIHVNTMALNKDIKDSNVNLEAAKETSNGMTSTVQDVAKGVIEQTESICQINKMMNEANEKITEVHNSSRQLAAISNTTSIIVFEGSEKISHMDKQMDIISNSVTESLTTVEELQNNMDEVDKFLSGITQIAVRLMGITKINLAKNK